MKALLGVTEQPALQQTAGNRAAADGDGRSGARGLAGVQSPGNELPAPCRSPLMSTVGPPAPVAPPAREKAPLFEARRSLSENMSLGNNGNAAQLEAPVLPQQPLALFGLAQGEDDLPGLAGFLDVVVGPAIASSACPASRGAHHHHGEFPVGFTRLRSNVRPSLRGMRTSLRERTRRIARGEPCSASSPSATARTS